MSGQRHDRQGRGLRWQTRRWASKRIAGFVTIIVPVLVFLSLQRYFVGGMTTGAVKG